MARTTTLTQNARYVGGSTISGASFTENITTPNDELLISASTFNIANLLPTAMTGKIVWSGLYQGIMETSITATVNGTEVGSVIFQTSSTQGARISWSSGATKTLKRVSNSAYTKNTSTFFKSTNPTVRQLNLVWTMYTSLNFNGISSGDVFIEPTVSSVTTSLSQKITLNVPPTATVSQVSFNTPYVYAGMTTASVTVSGATAYYGGTVSSVKLTIGNQTKSISGNGTISIALNASGTFTPTVTVTDSRSQTKTYTLNSITVGAYTKPSVVFDAERTTDTGVLDDEGTYATIPTTLTFDTTAEAVAPTVAVTDEDGITQTATTTWYSSRASDGTLSGAVTWATLPSGSTVYGLISITGGFNTQKSYVISLTPTDSEGIAGDVKTDTLQTAFYTVDFLAGGHGIAFGMSSSQDGFYCNMDTHLLQGVDVTGNATISGTTETLNVYIDLPNYQATGTTDKAIYDALVALGWDSDVIV